MCGVLRAQSSVGALQLIVGKIEVMKYDIMLCCATPDACKVVCMVSREKECNVNLTLSAN